MKNVRAIHLFFCFLPMTNLALGQNSINLTDLSLEELLETEIVVTASWYTQSLRDAPSLVSIVTVEAHAVSHLTLSTGTGWKGWTASFSLYNVFDQPYADPASEEHVQPAIAQDGRAVRFRLSHRIGF